MSDSEELGELSGEEIEEQSNLPTNSTSSALDAPSPFAELDQKNKVALILYIVSLVFFGLFMLLLSLNGGQNDWEWSKAIYEWAQKPENAQTSSFLIGLASLIGGFLIPLVILLIGLVFVISRNKKVMKYGGVFVVTTLIGFVIMVILMILSNRAITNYEDKNSFVPWYNFTPGFPNSPFIMIISFPSLWMTISGVVFGLPYCFNSQKLKVWKILTGTLATIFMFLMGWALVATGKNYLSDVIFAGTIQFWIAALVGKRILAIREQELYDIYDRVHLPVEKAYQKILRAKSVLNYSEIPILAIKAQRILEPALEKAKAQKEKGKEVPYLNQLQDALENCKKLSALETYNQEKATELNEKMLELCDDLSTLERPPKFVEKVQPYFVDISRIIEDNKHFALELLEEALELYNTGIEAATIEPGDFQYVIDKANVWKEYVIRFKEELEALPDTKGPEFENYMRSNFLYII